jgi:hypothetical protein
MSDDKLMQILFSEPDAAKAAPAVAPMDKDDDTEDTPPTILASDPRMRSAVDDVLRGLMLTPRRGSKAKLGGRARAARPAPVIEPGLSLMSESVDDAVEAAPPSPPAFAAPPGQPAVLAPPETTSSRRIAPMVSARTRPVAPDPEAEPAALAPPPSTAAAAAQRPTAPPAPPAAGWVATGAADPEPANRAGAAAKEATSSGRSAASPALGGAGPAASAPAPGRPASGWSSASAPATNPAMRPHLAARTPPPSEPAATSPPLSAARTPPPSEPAATSRPLSAARTPPPTDPAPSTRWPPASRVSGESTGASWPAANARATAPVEPAGWSARTEAQVDAGPSWQGSTARVPSGGRPADVAGAAGALPTASPWQGPPARPGASRSPAGWDDSSVPGDLRGNAERTGGKHRVAAWDADAMLDESSASQKRTKVVVESSLRSPRSIVTLHGEEAPQAAPPAVIAPPERHAVLVVVALGVALAVLLVVALLQDLLALGV